MKKYIIMLAFTGLAASCSQTEEVATDDSQEIRVEAELSGSRATATNFEEGDKLALFAVEYENEVAIPLQVSGNFLNNEALTYNGTQWNATRTLYWSDKACDFYGIYPYQEVTSIDAQLFDIATDQSLPETQISLSGYEASDLMWAKAENVSKGTNSSVQLKFKHMMSKVVVKLEKGPKFEDELPEEINTHIYNTATTAMVNWQKGSLEKYALSNKNTIKMRQVAEDTFEAIVVPQFIERNTPLIEITMEGIAYLLEYSMSFRPGYQHTLTITLNTSPDQEKIEINIEGSVDGWTED